MTIRSVTSRLVFYGIFFWVAYSLADKFIPPVQGGIGWKLTGAITVLFALINSITFQIIGKITDIDKIDLGGTPDARLKEKLTKTRNIAYARLAISALTLFGLVGFGAWMWVLAGEPLPRWIVNWTVILSVMAFVMSFVLIFEWRALDTLESDLSRLVRTHEKKAAALASLSEDG